MGVLKVQSFPVKIVKYFDCPSRCFFLAQMQYITVAGAIFLCFKSHTMPVTVLHTSPARRGSADSATGIALFQLSW